MRSKNLIISEFKVFRASHDLGECSAYDDVLASTILYHENGYISRYLKIALINDAELLDIKRNAISRNYYQLVFSRLLKQAQSDAAHLDSAEMVRVAIQDAFTLSAAQSSRGVLIDHCAYKELETLDDVNKALHDMTDDYKKIFYSPSTPKASSVIKEIFETFIDSGHAVISTSSQVTEQAVTSLHLEPSGPNVDIPAIKEMHIAGLVLHGINFISVPAMYIYYLAKGEKIPFSFDNNLKLFLSGSALTLGIISVTVPPAALGILFTFAAIGMAASIAGMVMHIIKYARLTQKIAANKNEIETLSLQIESLKNQAAKIKQNFIIEFEKNPADPARLQQYATQLSSLHKNYQACRAALKYADVTRRNLAASKLQSGSPIRVLNSGLQIFLAAAFIAGAVLSLTPFTAPIGTIIMTTVAIIGLASFIAGKVDQWWQKRRADQRIYNVKADAEVAVLPHESLAHVAEALDPAHAKGDLMNMVQRHCNQPAVVAMLHEKVTENRDQTTVANNEDESESGDLPNMLR
jgi:cell division protein FtsB